MDQPFAIDLTRTALELRRTRILATVGPASDTPEMVSALLGAGVDAFRLNLSHGSQEGHARVYEVIRRAARDAGRLVTVVADLCGPKTRVGVFREGGIDLAAGERVTVTVRDVVGEPGLIVCEYRALASDVRPGDRVLLDDGRLEMRVVEAEGTEVACEVVRGGRLTDRKGMNFPGVALSTPTLTDKDRADAAFAADLGVDWIALSFVREAADVEALKALLAGRGRDTPVIAKIEKPEALEHIGEILTVADGIMIARGDLGVEMEAEEVPVLQQQLVRVARQARRPVIVATQMLETMIERSRPTRAEVSDVAAAAMAGVDAVMLSGETAVGRYPVEAVTAMDRVLRLVEGFQWEHGHFGGLQADCGEGPQDAGTDTLGAALSRATSQLSRDLSVHAIIVPAVSGRTAATVAAVRPAAPIVAASSSVELCRRLALHWGLTPLRVEPGELEDPPGLARRLAARLGVAHTGDLVLLVWDSSAARSGRAPTVTILRA